jgi:predicted glutamine amidotransferase
MCRMMAAPSGIPGRLAADAFLRMAQGKNAVNEQNTSLGLVSHGDGWGAVLEFDGRIARVRSPRPCWDDGAFSQSRAASVLLLHARRASVSGVSEANSHPFQLDVDGEPWYFCHNGTIRDLPDDEGGATDSERFFRRLSPLLSRVDPVTAFQSVAEPLRDYTSLNSFLLGPTGLWAFCAWMNPQVRTYYTLVWAETPYGIVVASEPLPEVGAGWVPMENGSALRVDARTGDVVTMPMGLPARGGTATTAAA